MKYLYSTLVGMFIMMIVMMLYMQIEIKLFGSDIYNDSIYRDMKSVYVLLGIILVKVVEPFMMTYIHEKLPRCGGSLWNKVWRFSLMIWLIMIVPGLIMTGATMNIDLCLVSSWALSGLIQVFAASFAIIHILYKYPAPNTSCKIG